MSFHRIPSVGMYSDAARQIAFTFLILFAFLAALSPQEESVSAPLQDASLPTYEG